MKKTLVLGIGNTIRGDDGVGILAVRELKEKIVNPLFDIKETHEAGLSLLDLISGYEKAVIIDSIHTGKLAPGDIYKFTREDFESAKEPYSSHQIGLGTILEMAGKYNIDVPKEITVYAVEIENADSFKDGLTPQIEKAVFKVADLVKKELFS